MARRIQTEAELRDGENWSYCVGCRHLVAIGLDDPSWGHVPPRCEVCLLEKRCWELTRRVRSLSRQVLVVVVVAVVLMVASQLLLIFFG